MNHKLKFYYDPTVPPVSSQSVIQLKQPDYPHYLSFFTTQHPATKVNEWLKDYFEEQCHLRLAFGYFIKDQWFGASDGPEMPYLPDFIQEIGINTLPDYRGPRYTQLAATACLQSILSSKKCPIWSCGLGNEPSRRLTSSIGFKKLADVLTISC